MLSGFIRIVFCGLFHDLKKFRSEQRGGFRAYFDADIRLASSAQQNPAVHCFDQIGNLQHIELFYRLKRASPLLFDLCDTQTGGSVAQQGDIDQPLTAAGGSPKRSISSSVTSKSVFFLSDFRNTAVNFQSQAGAVDVAFRDMSLYLHVDQDILHLLGFPALRPSSD